MEEQTHDLRHHDKPRLISYHMSVEFHPAIKLDGKQGSRFAAELSGPIDIDGSQLSTSEWWFSSQRSGLAICVRPNRLEVNTASGTLQPQEVYDHLYGIVLDRFHDMFKPQIVLSSHAMVRLLLQVDGDARTFIASRVMNIGPDRFAPLHRPIHILGMRVFLPPFQVDADEPTGADDALEIKIESYVEDPSKVFVEVDGSWSDAMPWNDQTRQIAISRLSSVWDSFGVIKGFLSNDTDSSEGDEE